MHRSSRPLIAATAAVTLGLGAACGGGVEANSSDAGLLDTEYAEYGEYGEYADYAEAIAEEESATVEEVVTYEYVSDEGDQAESPADRQATTAEEEIRLELADAVALASPDTVIPPGSRDVFRVEGSGEYSRLITDVRVAAHDGFDRVVFDLAGDPDPGWWAQFVDEPSDDGSGHPVEVPGEHFLQLRIGGLRFPLTDDGELEGYDGESVLFNGAAVSSVIYRFWFEGYVTVFIGLAETQSQVSITALDNPARVVVDVSH